ncbi:MAG TPA: mannose-1-phosphate guanylyltransferase/mannose-6-phosphate isomerase [Gammaproteobacteria bacterium]|nr:mannose-1-phosphate guanylyltransferase/mannose-6-phosphate isomerase [Gammaproteobacteria bacterium]
MSGEDTKLVPIVLSGGKGTRLWPVSREARPKPFMRVGGERSLLQETFLRSGEFADVARLLLVTNKEFYFASRDELSAVMAQLPCDAIDYLLEPVGRNTAPAIGLAARHVIDSLGGDAVLLVMPSDHLIRDRKAFAKAVQRAVSAARQGNLVTFGIVPEYPETGFGYIEVERGETGGSVRVKRFVEKPDIETARHFVESGRHYWNAGIFCFRADTVWSELERHAPEVADGVARTWQATRRTAAAPDAPLHIDPETFASVPDISIDYAVMERSSNVVVVPGDFGWSDVGSWEAVASLAERDGRGNAVVGQAVLVETADTYVQSETRLVATVGVRDLLVIDTPDALLITRKGSAQLVKEVVRRLGEQNHEARVLHRTVHRPWGTYTVIEETPHYKIKRLEVKPGASLSLQMHRHRSEHWVVVHGVARVTNGEHIFLLERDQSTYIPAGNKHRLENPGKEPVVIIETQTGTYLGEDDIVRFDDQYGRVPPQL